MKFPILQYYLRRDIQKAILENSQNREFIPKFLDSFGKRPDILQFQSDIEELAKQGATSFHISEERWKNPLLLESGMTKSQLDNLRLGWDAIIDIDCNFLEYSKICSELIIEALRFNNIENIGLKFSGNTGFHINIPFESFPSKVNNKETKLLFPDGVRVIASYLKQMIKQHLAERILELNTIEEISQATKKPLHDLKEGNKFNPYSILDIDSVLISSRHLYRAPYSINEKKFLVSLPIKPSELKNFKITQAKPEDIEPSTSFFPKVNEAEASNLIIQAFDSLKKQPTIQEETKQARQLESTNLKVNSNLFSPCINLGLAGLEDGKKRFLFCLLNYLKTLNWKIEDIEKLIYEWNKKNPKPLKDGYLISQLNWNKKQNQKILPPNCTNLSYYVDIGICKPDNLCKLIKNPVSYSLKKQKLFQQKPAKKSSKSS